MSVRRLRTYDSHQLETPIDWFCALRASLAAVFVLTVSGAATAQDLLVFRNGDRLTGTIQRIERGVVFFLGTNIDGEIRVGWERIERVESDRSFQFSTADGRSLVGQMGVAPDDQERARDFLIVRPEASIRVPQEEIIYVAQTLRGRTGLLEADLGAGFSLAKSNSQKQTTAHGDVSYETAGWSTSLRFNSVFATQRETTNTNRQSATVDYSKRLSPNWNALFLGDYLTSEEQQIDRRVVVGGGPSRSVIRSSRINFDVLGGLVWNRERFSVEAGQTFPNNQIEAVFGAALSAFRFKQVTFDTTLFAYPGLSEAGRLRLDWRARLRLRLVPGQPFWWSVNQTFNYDSDPPVFASGTDYVTTTSLSWVFP